MYVLFGLHYPNLRIDFLLVNVLQFHQRKPIDTSNLSMVKFVLRILHKGVSPMTNTERELINIIRENENPEQALLTAVLIIGSVLERPLSFQEPFADSQQGLA